MTGFATPPSTIRTISLIRIVTTHLKCDQRNFIISQVEYTRTRVVIRFQIKRDQDYSSPSSILFYYFAYLIWMIFAMRMWNNNDDHQGNAIQSQLDAMRSQIADNQNSSLVMDAIRGNANAITQLASNLNCDFNALNNAICCVRSGIQEVAGNVNFSAERVINAINLGDANLTSALQNCCCQTQQNIIKMGYENQLGQKDIVNQMQTGFSQTNSGLERAASNLGFQMSQIACDLKTNANANTQRIVDVLNNHWQSDLQQRYNDARLELSQQKQNATLIAALKTTAAA